MASSWSRAGSFRGNPCQGISLQCESAAEGTQAICIGIGWERPEGSSPLPGPCDPFHWRGTELYTNFGVNFNCDSLLLSSFLPSLPTTLVREIALGRQGRSITNNASINTGCGGWGIKSIEICNQQVVRDNEHRRIVDNGTPPQIQNLP